MGGTMTTNELMATVQNCQIDWGPFRQGQIPYQQIQPFPNPPSLCFGDVHVFPCPHCEKCKCGKATVRRDAKPTK